MWPNNFVFNTLCSHQISEPFKDYYYSIIFSAYLIIAPSYKSHCLANKGTFIPGKCCLDWHKTPPRLKFM